MEPLKIFLSYAREDKDLLDELVKHFAPFVRAQKVELWFDDQLEVGQRWREEIEQRIARADVFVMLLSKDYLASSFCMDAEAAQAQAEHFARQLRIVPIYARAVAFHDTWIADFQVLPSADKPLEPGAPRHERLMQICATIAGFGAAGATGVLSPHSTRATLSPKAPAREERPCAVTSSPLVGAFDGYDALLQKLFAELQPFPDGVAVTDVAVRASYLAGLSRGLGVGALAWYDAGEIAQLGGESGAQTRLKQAFAAVRGDHAEALDTGGACRLEVKRGRGKAQALIVLPLAHAAGLVVLETAGRGAEFDEIVSLVLRAIAEQSDGLTRPVAGEALRLAVYDALKRRYQHVSDTVYEARFAGFQRDLSQVGVSFEPIYRFDKQLQKAFIFGWEALARRPGADRAPVDILSAAELWGTRFKTELDLYMLEKSIHSYKGACSRIRHACIEEARPLSVNIYPETLFRLAYQERLERLLNREKQIPGRNLILEVSEKSLLDERSGATEGARAFTEFTRKIRQDYRVSFAIDDFGAGYSSISRLDQLKPKYVKIDREILHCETQFAKTLIRTLLAVEHNYRAGAFDVIIEGLDRESRITLAELVNELGVEYIQGHLLGTAHAEIFDRPPPATVSSIHAAAGWGQTER
ncbi:MAG: EAL domain-containing protein [Thiotrichales bacterium]